MASDSKKTMDSSTGPAHQAVETGSSDHCYYQHSGSTQPEVGLVNATDSPNQAVETDSPDHYQHSGSTQPEVGPDSATDSPHQAVETDSPDHYQHSGSTQPEMGPDSATDSPHQAVETVSTDHYHYQHSGSTQPEVGLDNEGYYQQSGSSHPGDEYDNDDDYYQEYCGENISFDRNYLYHRGTAYPYNSDSEDEEPHQHREENYSMDSAGPRYQAYNRVGSPGAHPRVAQTQSSEDDESTETGRKVVDPGSFQYNKRVFITALPCLLLTLIMTGEMLLLMVTIGSMMIALMVHMGEDVNKRCVVMFALLFIPCHILVVGTVFPLLWLSVWNLVLVVIVNMFCILTGGWIIVQFVAFRTEEPAMCASIERALFSVYPCVCSALVTWVMSTVVSLHVTPFIFICIWFVCLQLYLIPAVSSFKVLKKQQAEDEDCSILPQPILMTIITAFVLSGPVLHVVSTAAGSSSVGLFSLQSIAFLAVLLCLGVFLSTLLSLRQLCEFMGWSHLRVVQARWVSGVGVVLLCYPVLQQLGLVSHFLGSLPVAVAGFAALGLTLSLKKGKVVAVMLMAMLMVLVCLWLHHLPWALTYHFLDVISMKSFYALVGANFLLCVLAIYAAWYSSKELFGSLLLLQCVGLTACETGLYQAGLYSLPTFQVTGVVSAYTLHRLYLANKLSRTMATLCSAVQLTKTVVGAVGYLVQQGLRDQGQVVVEISPMDFVTMLLLVGVLVWLFVYETNEEVSLLQAGQHLTLLMVSLAVSGQSFLAPIGHFLLQDDLTLPDIVGLWYGLGGGLVLLYALQHKQSPGVLDQLTKVAMVMGGVGALVMVMQPHFDMTLYAVFQWSEVFSVLLVAALLVTGVEVGFSQTLVTAGLLGVCPGVHATLLLYEDLATVAHFVLLAVLSCTLLAFLIIIIKIQHLSEAAERFIKLGSLVAGGVVVGVLAVDIINFEYMDGVWDYPAWTVALVVFTSISLSLKVLAMKLGPRNLPLTKEDNSGMPLIPIIGNTATVLAFLLARTQGPDDVLLHDLWCCAASLVLILLQRDSLFLSSLSPSNRATPTVMAAVATLIFSTILQSRLWAFSGTGSVILGLMEISAVLGSLPVYMVLAGIMWRGEIWSEQAVVFTMPLNAFVFLLGTLYTSWALCVAGFVSGLGMMMLKLPLLPHNYELMQR